MIKDFPIEIIDQMLEDIHVGLTLVGTDGKILWCNKLATELLGWDEQNSKTTSVLKCHKPEMHQQVIHKINNCKLKREWHRIITMSSVPRSPTPGKLKQSCHYGCSNVAFCSDLVI